MVPLKILGRRVSPWTIVGLAAASGVVLAAVSHLLGSVESVGLHSYDAGVFTGPKLRFRDTTSLAEAVELWSSSTYKVPTLITWHVLVDSFAFVPAYCGLLWLVLKRLSRGSGFAFGMVLVLALVDLLENAVTFATLVGTDLRPTHDALVRLQAVTLVKWGMLAAVLTAVAARWLRLDSNDKNELDRLIARVKYARTAASQRPAVAVLDLILLVVLFAALIAFPAGGPLEQLPDVLRRALLGEAVHPVAKWSAAGFLLLLASVAVAASWATVATPSRAAEPKWLPPFVVAGALTACAQIAEKHWDRATNAAAWSALLVVGALSAAALLAQRGGAVASDAEPPVEKPRAALAHAIRRRRWVGGLAGVVTMAGGVGLLRAAFPPMILPVEGRARWVLAFGTGAILTVWGGLWTQRAVMWAHDKLGWWFAAAVAAIVLVASRRLWLDPALGASLGTAGVMEVAFAFLALVIGGLKFLSRRTAPWTATHTLGFRRGTPWLALAAATWLVAGAVNKEGVYHDARVEVDSTRYEPRYANLDTAFQGWNRAVDAACRDHPMPPMVLVAAPGGGIRAAYWTAAGLDALFVSGDDRCRSAALFAISGASGGSVGAATWLAAQAHGKRGREVVADLSGDRGLAAATVGLLFHDLFQPFTGIRKLGADRAALLEDGFIDSADGVFGTVSDPLSWGELGGHGGWVPVVVLNGSSVADGCRVLLANVGTLPYASGADCVSGPRAGQTPGPVTAAIDPFPGLYPRDSTPHCDTLGTTMRAVTAAVLSARFPGVTPSGALLRCVSTTRPVTPARPGSPARDSTFMDSVTTYTVDGGYYENSGLWTLLQVWERLAPMVRAHNCGATAARQIVPWIVVLDNYYRSGARTAVSARPRELLVPLRTSRNKETLGQAALEQLAMTAMAPDGRRCPARADSSAIKTPPPGPKFASFVVISPSTRPAVSAPLGWVLSSTSRDDLKDQLRQRLDTAVHPDSAVSELVRQLSAAAHPGASEEPAVGAR